MKRILLFVFSLFIVSLSHANIYLNGIEYTIDTLSMYPVGPGTTFYELRMLRVSGVSRLDCWLLAVDTRDPYVSVEQVLGTGKITGTETPSSMANRSTNENKIFFAGSNGDFFITQDDQSTGSYNEVGMPAGTTIVNGEYALTPAGAGGGRRAGGVAADGKGVASYTHNVSMKVILPDATTLNINHANYVRGENELVLYNHHNGAATYANAYGNEVQIQLLEGETWNTTGTMKAKVTKVQHGVGGMPLDKDHAVLSGHGTMATAIEGLQVGDEITLDFEMRLDNEVVNVAQLIGGDHYSAMILEDGKIAQSGYWDELHPRTGFGVSQTRDTVFMLVVDGRSAISAGCTTKVLAEILKHYGAYNAVNWDGGGSSCICVRPFGPMNNGSDGRERACANGMFAVANVPDTDNTIVAIAPYMPNYYLPRYGVAAPQFLGYNKYGVLVETNVTGVQLSCAPEVGEILADGRFLASGENGGKLVATWGDVSTELDVRISATAPIAIRVDTVICARKPYKVEVEGTVGNNTVEILSSALTWSSSDPTIATIDEEGIVYPQSSGLVTIKGQMGGFTDYLVVKVEYPETDPMVWDDFRNVNSWELKSSPSSFKPSLSVPEDPALPVNLIFTYGSGRNPFIQLSKDSLLYSVPEKIRVPMTTNAVFEKVIIMIRANNSNTTDQITFLNPKVGEENIFEIDVKERFGDDVAIYPLHFLSLKMVPTSETPKGECYVTLPGIIEIFDESNTTDVEDVTSSSSTTYKKYLKDGNLYIQAEDKTYNVLGTQVSK
ncbi:MAG: phosphodiester glycosidase family protein [Paludibacteraceae bacterium]|nr:phosphodiester glycosidase family protein [Paludibacteraceae bacterium]